MSPKTCSSWETLPGLSLSEDAMGTAICLLRANSLPHIEDFWDFAFLPCRPLLLLALPSYKINPFCFLGSPQCQPLNACSSWRKSGHMYRPQSGEVNIGAIPWSSSRTFSRAASMATVGFSTCQPDTIFCFVQYYRYLVSPRQPKPSPPPFYLECHCWAVQPIDSIDKEAER